MPFLFISTISIFSGLSEIEGDAIFFYRPVLYDVPAVHYFCFGHKLGKTAYVRHK
jgi:hypothetical protein